LKKPSKDAGSRDYKKTEAAFGQGVSLNKISIENYRDEINSAFSEKRAVIFLCGPTLKDLSKPGAQVRKKLMDLLEQDGFEVVLGEDDGLEELRAKFHGYAHLNELDFIKGPVNAVVLVADSVGSFCELGLFAHEKAIGDDNQTDFILVMNEEFQGGKSYINEGPAAAIEDYGKVVYANFSSFDASVILTRLRRRRSLFISRSR